MQVTSTGIATYYRKIKVCIMQGIRIRAEINTRFAWIFTGLHNYSNAMKVFGYTTSDFGVVILVYLVNIYIFKAVSVIH